MNRQALPITSGLCVALAIVICAACGGTGLKEIQRVGSGSLDIVMLSRDGSLHQRDVFTIEFQAASGGNLVNVGTVRASATMPMPGMAPMFGSIDVRATDTPGRYTATGSLDMAGGWRISLEWDGPIGH